MVFLLWGGFAQKKEYLIDRTKHAVVKVCKFSVQIANENIFQTAHPSPLSARLWFGCKCFSKTNELLVNYGVAAIDWNDLQKSY